MPEEIETIQHLVPVTATAAGEPHCPYCGLVMVSDDDGVSWACPEGVAVLRVVRDSLAAAFDRAFPPTPQG